MTMLMLYRLSSLVEEGGTALQTIDDNNSKAGTKTSPESLFLALPAEIRTMIYQSLYENARFMFPDDVSILFYSFSHFFPKNLSSAILLVCKQIHHEARLVMYGTNIKVLIMVMNPPLIPRLTHVERLPLPIRKQVKMASFSVSIYRRYPPLGAHWPNLESIHIHGQHRARPEDNSLQTIEAVRKVRRRLESGRLFRQDRRPGYLKPLPQRRVTVCMWYYRMDTSGGNGLVSSKNMSSSSRPILRQLCRRSSSTSKAGL